MADVIFDHPRLVAIDDALDSDRHHPEPAWPHHNLTIRGRVAGVEWFHL